MTISFEPTRERCGVCVADYATENFFSRDINFVQRWTKLKSVEKQRSYVEKLCVCKFSIIVTLVLGRNKLFIKNVQLVNIQVQFRT